MGIYSFNREYKFLAIEYPIEIEFEGVVYKSALAAFAACRFSGKNMKDECLVFDNTVLFYIVNTVLEGPLVVDNFRQLMYDKLYNIMEIKFNSKELKKQFLNLKNETIVFISKKDDILGTYSGRGMNLLGDVLTTLKSIMILNEKSDAGTTNPMDLF